MDNIKRNYITIDGIRFAYEEYGSGQPILFIHGFAASSYAWRKVAQSLSSKYRAICIDLMGFGYSDKPKNDSYSPKRQAELMLKAIDALKLDRPIIAGHSFGGGVCLTMMQMLGERQKSTVSGLILLDAACYPQKLPYFIRNLRIPLLSWLALKIFPERWGFLSLKGTIYKDEHQAEEAITEYANRLKSKGAHEALIATAKEIGPHDIDALIDSYSKISVPTLILWGGCDSIIQVELGYQLAEQIPNSEIQVFDGCEHCPHEESPDEIASSIDQFFDANSPIIREQAANL